MAIRSGLTLSNSSLKTLLRCEQQYAYKYIDGLEPKRNALPLKLGSWIHSLIEEYYKTGDWKQEHAKLSRDFAKLMPEERDFFGDMPKQAGAIMRGYLYNYKSDAQDWTILNTELRIELPLGKAWTFVGIVDVEAENEEGLWLWDHKTFKGRAPTSDYRTTDPQSALYVWAFERIYGRKPVGFVFNYLRTKLPSVPHLNKDGSVSRAKIDTNWITYARFLRDQGLEPADFRPQLSEARARNKDYFDRVFIPKPAAVINNLLLDIQEKAPRIKEIHEGRRPTRTLTMDCNRCSYHLLCLTELVGGDGTYIRKHDYKPRRDLYDDDQETLITEDA